MNTRTGIVMKIEKSTLYLMTSDGEFVKVRLDKKEALPMIGSEYCGEVIKHSFIRNNIFKYASVACLMLFTLLGGGGAYAYYKPVSTITININPSIELKSNRWEKVISANPVNEDGKKVLQEISLKNKTVEDALLLILDQSKKDKFINENYINNNTVQISIKGKELSLSSFEKKVNEDAVSIKIDNNGTIIYNKDSINKNGISPDSKKNITDTTEEHSTDIDKNNTKINTVNDNLPLNLKNEDKQKDEDSNNSNKSSKINNNNNNKSDDASTIYKEKVNNDTKDVNSKNKNSKDNDDSDNSEKNNQKSSNNKEHSSDIKDKKDK